MYDLAEMIKTTVMPKVFEIGLDKFEGQRLDDLKDWIEIQKNCLVIKAMQEDEEEKRYYTENRGTNINRTYVEPDYRMSKEDYRKNDAQYYRDMDRKKGIMYYTEPTHGMSKYDSAMRNYTETKEMTPHDEHANMKAVEKVANVFTEDIKEWIPKMTPSEKTMLKQKLSNVEQMIG